MKMKIKIEARWILAAALVTVLTLAGCSRKSGGEDEDAGTPQDAVAEVTVTQVTRGEISTTLTSTGDVAALPNQDVKVSALVPGRIARMMVGEGDQVREGQALATIDSRPFEDQVRQAQAAVSQAQANLDNAKLARDRNENLFQRGIAARKDLEDARTQMSVTQAALQQAEAQLSLAKLQLERAEVRSPLAGTVVKRMVSDGEQVDGTAATPLFEVANLGEVEVFGNIPALYLGRIRVGEQIPVTADAFPGRTFDGQAVAISPAVDPTTNVGMVRIRIANQQHLLRLGMFSTAQVPLETHAQAMLVPAAAVYRDAEGKPEVYRVRGETVEAVPVEVGIETKDRTELLSGVNPGDTVVVTGGYGLADNAKIKVKS